MSKTRRALLLTALALALLAAGVVTVWSIYTRHRLRSFRAELIARGEKLTMAELIDQLTPEDYEAGAAFARIMGRTIPGFIQPARMSLVAPGKCMAGASRERVGEPGAQTNTWDEVSAQLADYREPMEAARELLRRDEIAVRLNYSQGFNMLLPHLAPCKGLVNRFNAASMLALHTGDLAAASQHIATALRVARAIAHDHILISELVRIACAAIANSAVWEAVQRDGWQDAQLAEIQQACQSNEFAAPLIRSLEFEQAMVLEMFDQMRRSHATARQIMDGVLNGGAAPVVPAKYLGFDSLQDVLESLPEVIRGKFATSAATARNLLWRWFWSYDDEYYHLKLSRDLLAAVRAGRDQRSLAECHRRLGIDTKESFEGILTTVPSWCLLTRSTLPSITKAFYKAANAENYRQMVLTALALKRHQIRSGNLPERLDQLVPEFLAEPPRDWMDGGLLRYRRESPASYVLYSAGENYKDDGGNPEKADKASVSRNVMLGLDFVWPKVATEAEIEAFVIREKKRR